MSTYLIDPPIAKAVDKNTISPASPASQTKWRDTYQVPGGKIELGESIEDALRREIKEELGLEIIAVYFSLCSRVNITQDHIWLERAHEFAKLAVAYQNKLLRSAPRPLSRQLRR